ncbi:DUF1893 domain-containing protein [Pelolinea submarina]|uniref:Uncharacterized protein DUF1893 n=1 Tax=Pelolinea submarina TaxID=913107 RepID=A0A3E0AG77_9CHLR|nr:DUF1893 domain-containing protein [Pelolinea submarina]REG10584.1 uncharacterized protein DUF1893 [Pelolinea submarina]
MEKTTLRILQNGRIIFQSEKRWLMPLFDFEEYLHDHPQDTAALEFHDKVIGKAAALLMIRLGAAGVHGDVMSRLACGILDHHAIPYTYKTLVDRIDCQTEQILLEIDDPESAYAILAERAHRSAS